MTELSWLFLSFHFVTWIMLVLIFIELQSWKKEIRQHIDYDKVFKSAFANKLNDFYSAMNWGLIPENNNLGKFFSF